MTVESPCAENSRTELKEGNAHAKGLRYIIRPGPASGMHEIEPMRQAWELFYTCMGLFIAPRLRAWILHGFCMDSDYMDFEGASRSHEIKFDELCELFWLTAQCSIHLQSSGARPPGLLQQQQADISRLRLEGQHQQDVPDKSFDGGHLALELHHPAGQHPDCGSLQAASAKLGHDPKDPQAASSGCHARCISPARLLAPQVELASTARREAKLPGAVRCKAKLMACIQPSLTCTSNGATPSGAPARTGRIDCNVCL